MKKLALFVLLVGSCCSAMCLEWQNLKPYAGADAQIRRTPFGTGYGNNEFRQNYYPAGNIFLGLQFNRYFGIEAGYFNAPWGKVSSVVSRGATMGNDLGIDVVPDAQIVPNALTANTKAQFKGFNASVVGFLPLDEGKNQLVGAIGLSRVHAQMIYQPTYNGLYPLYETAKNAWRRDFSKTKYVAQIRFGLEHSFNECVSLRALLGWENTSRMRMIKAKQIQSASTVSLKDTYTVSIGIVGRY